MQDAAIQRLRYRLRENGCLDIHIKVIAGNFVRVSFIYGTCRIRRTLSIANLDLFPQFRICFDEV